MKNKSIDPIPDVEQPLPTIVDTGRIRIVFSDILFWFMAIFLLFVYLGAKEIWVSEDRWAEIVRQMKITGDYFHPSINGQPYFDKPLLSYWFIAMASAITGRLDETVLRLPSAIAGLLALFGTISLGKRLFSKKQAMTAGWLLLGTYAFVFWARTGEADMENLAAIILAVAWYWARRDRPGFFSYMVFYLICFLGAHTKGMASIAVPILVVLPDLFREKRWKSYLSVSHFLALALGLSLYLAPFLYSEMTRTGYKSSGIGMAFKENIVRYFRPFDHKEPFYIYFYHLPKMLFPWIVLFVGAIWAFCGNFRQLRWPAKWLAIATGLIFLFFTLSGSRRSYYILPILPFCALMISQYLDVEKKEKSKLIILGIQMWMLVVIMALEILSPLLWPVLKKRIGFEASGELRLATFILGLLALICFIPNIVRTGLLSGLLGTEQRLARPIVISIIIVGGFFTWQQNCIESFRTDKAFILELKDHADILGSDNIVFFKNLKTKILFYMKVKKPLLVLRNVSELESLLNSKNNTWILVSRGENSEEIASVLTQEILSKPILQEKVFPWEQSINKYQAWLINKSKDNVE